MFVRNNLVCIQVVIFKVMAESLIDDLGFCPVSCIKMGNFSRIFFDVVLEITGGVNSISWRISGGNVVLLCLASCPSNLSCPANSANRDCFCSSVRGYCW
jgi:hypothetical protein